jgi:hypothetical protein
MMLSPAKSIRRLQRERHRELYGAAGVYGSHPTGVYDMDYQIAFAATVATASFLVFMLVVHRT